MLIHRPHFDIGVGMLGLDECCDIRQFFFPRHLFILVSLLIPFGAYSAAEHLGCSGILAAVGAGVTMTFAEFTQAALPTTRIRRNTVWDTIQFAGNGIIFVLLGEQFPAILDSAQRSVHDAGHHSGWWLLIYVLASPDAFMTHEQLVQDILHSMAPYKGR